MKKNNGLMVVCLPNIHKFLCSIPSLEEKSQLKNTVVQFLLTFAFVSE